MKATTFLESVLFVFILISFSCKLKEDIQPDSSGAPLELVVITDNHDQWTGPIGETIDAFFGQNITTLPQPEPYFKVLNYECSAFNSMIQKHHNIFIVTIDRNLSKPFVEINNYLWTSPQCVIKMTCPSNETFFTEFEENKNSFMKQFHYTDIRRTIKTNSLSLQPSIDDRLKNDFNLTLDVPSGYYIAIENINFMWLRHETMTHSEGICIYFENYRDTNQFNPDYIIHVRDSVMKLYVLGPREGSYMSTSIDPIFPEFKSTQINGLSVLETRGLWETAGEYMGGPFISYTTHDKKRGRITTLEGFVYAPREDKAPLLLKVESILNTVKFTDLSLHQAGLP